MMEIMPTSHNVSGLKNVLVNKAIPVLLLQHLVLWCEAIGVRG